MEVVGESVRVSTCVHIFAYPSQLHFHSIIESFNVRLSIMKPVLYFMLVPSYVHLKL